MKYLFLFCMLAAAAMNFPDSVALSATPPDAEAVLTRYFNALSQGDVPTLRSLTTGDLLAARTPLFNNPTYPAFLSSTYGNAHFHIDSVTRVSAVRMAVDVTITFDQNNVSRRRYLLSEKSSENSLIPPVLQIYDDKPADSR